MVVIVKSSDCNVVGSCEDGIVDIIELHDDLLLGSEKGVKDCHVFLEVPVDTQPGRHRGRHAPYLDVAEEEKAEAVIVNAFRNDRKIKYCCCERAVFEWSVGP